MTLSLWYWVPFVLSCLVGTGYENGGAEDPAAAEPDGSDPDYAEIVAVLADLGYRPLGVGFMKLFFFRWNWVVRTRVWAFRSPTAQRFAFVQRGPFPSHRYNQVLFATCWDDGGLLLTTGGVAETSVLNGPDRINMWATEDVSTIEERHADAVARLEAKGRTPDPDMSLEHLLSVTRDRARRSRGRDRSVAAAQLFPLFALYSIMTAAVTWVTGLWHAAPALACLGTLVLVRLLDLHAYVEHARSLHQQVRKDRAAPLSGGPDWGDTE